MVSSESNDCTSIVSRHGDYSFLEIAKTKPLTANLDCWDIHWRTPGGDGGKLGAGIGIGGGHDCHSQTIRRDIVNNKTCPSEV